MEKELSRRSFLKMGTTAAAAMAVSPSLLMGKEKKGKKDKAEKKEKKEKAEKPPKEKVQKEKSQKEKAPKEKKKKEEQTVEIVEIAVKVCDVTRIVKGSISQRGKLRQQSQHIAADEEGNGRNLHLLGEGTARPFPSPGRAVPGGIPVRDNKRINTVEEGALVACIPEKALSANIHASISGTVTEVTGDYIVIQA